MPHDCSEGQISNVYRSTVYGKVGFIGKTYTEKYYPKGRYFPDIDSYDKECQCPIFRTEIRNPENEWNTLYSTEYLNDSTTPVEVLRLRVLVQGDPKRCVPIFCSIKNPFFKECLFCCRT